MSSNILEDMGRTGLFSEHHGLQVRPAAHEKTRLTIPAREALLDSGAVVVGEPMDMSIDVPTYTVTLGERVPAGLVVVATFLDNLKGSGYFDVLSLRMDNEPPYPNEQGCDIWRQLDFTPCPKCGAPLVWYEAGYVPGYRVCAKKPHHHWLAKQQ